MFKEGTRVVIVDAKMARSYAANVCNGDKGTIGIPRSEGVNVHIDGDTSPIPWAVPASCVRRIHEAESDR